MQDSKLKELNEFTNHCLRLNPSHDLVQFFSKVSNKKDPLVSLNGSLMYYKKILSRYEKHLAKRMHTEKWTNKGIVHLEQLINASAIMLKSFTEAHHYQIQLFRFLLVITSNDENIEFKSTPNTFSTLLQKLSKEEKLFFPEEVQYYKTFNTFRNMIIHAPTDSIAKRINSDVISLVLELLQAITKLNNMVFSKYPHELGKLIADEMNKLDDDFIEFFCR